MDQPPRPHDGASVGHGDCGQGREAGGGWDPRKKARLLTRCLLCPTTYPLTKKTTVARENLLKRQQSKQNIPFCEEKWTQNSCLERSLVNGSWASLGHAPMPQ